jgi:hypothetical protein
MFLEHFMPRESIDYVEREWDLGRFREVSLVSYMVLTSGSLTAVSWLGMLDKHKFQVPELRNQ